MKILISRSSENQTIGGAELSARDQAIVLKNNGHQPVFMSNNEIISNELSAIGIETVGSMYIQRFRGITRYAYFWLMLPIKFVHDVLVVFRVKPDVINPHTREDQIIFTLSKWLHKRPIAWKDPGDMVFVLNRNHGLFGKIYYSLYLNAIKRADHIYMLSDEHVSTLLDVIGPDYKSKVSAIPSSIMYDQYQKDSVTKKSDRLVFGSICRLEDTKNIETLIKAYVKAYDQISQTKLVIVGAGSQSDQLKKLASAHPAIEFVGHSDNVSEYLNLIDVFVHPALQEGWGRSIKEAMYFGKAIIGANVGGIAVQINDGETGLLFDPTSVDELLQKMILLAHDSELREKLARNAEAKALADGDFNNTVTDQILPIYSSLLSENHDA